MVNACLLKTRLRKLFILLMGSAVLTALFSCSSEPVNPPAELQDFKARIWIERIWKRDVGSGDGELDLEFNPVRGANSVLTIDAYGILNALELEQGKRLWSRPMEERILGGLGYDSTYVYFTNFQGELVCVERETSNQRWRRAVSSEIVASPVSDGRTVVVQSIDGSIFAFDVAEGIQLWRYDSIGPVLSLRGTSAPQIQGDKVVAGFSNGELMGFDVRTGQVLWKVSIATPEGRTELERLVDVDGDPVIDGDRVYASAYQGNIASIDIRTGEEVWTKKASSYNGLAVDDKHVYASLEDGALLAINKTNSNEVWRNDELSYRRLGTPYVSGNLVFVSDFEGYVHVFSTEKGEILTRLQPDSDGVMGRMLIDRHHLYVYTRDGHLVAYHIFRSAE